MCTACVYRECCMNRHHQRVVSVADECFDLVLNHSEIITAYAVHTNIHMYSSQRDRRTSWGVVQVIFIRGAHRRAQCIIKCSSAEFRVWLNTAMSLHLIGNSDLDVTLRWKRIHREDDINQYRALSQLFHLLFLITCCLSALFSAAKAAYSCFFSCVPTKMPALISASKNASLHSACLRLPALLTLACRFIMLLFLFSALN